MRNIKYSRNSCVEGDGPCHLVSEGSAVEESLQHRVTVTGVPKVNKSIIMFIERKFVT